MKFEDYNSPMARECIVEMRRLEEERRRNLGFWGNLDLRDSLDCSTHSTKLTKTSYSHSSFWENLDLD